MNTLARIIRTREALEDGDVGLAAAILFNLEDDLAAGETHEARSAALTCPDCDLRFNWPGELDHHQRFVHFAEAA